MNPFENGVNFDGSQTNKNHNASYGSFENGVNFDGSQTVSVDKFTEIAV